MLFPSMFRPLGLLGVREDLSSHFFSQDSSLWPASSLFECPYRASSRTFSALDSTFCSQDPDRLSCSLLFNRERLFKDAGLPSFFLSPPLMVRLCPRDPSFLALSLSFSSLLIVNFLYDCSVGFPFFRSVLIVRGRLISLTTLSRIS